jgi:hypothetical protein
MQQDTPPAKARKAHPFGLTHRYGGIISAVLIIFICITGLLLNHTDDLELGKVPVDAEWLLSAYGIDTPAIISFGNVNISASQIANKLYYRTTPLSGNFSSLTGMVESGDTVIIATTDELILLTRAGELIETLEAYTGIPAYIRRIGLHPELGPALNTASGDWHSNTELMNWEALTDTKTIAWSGPVLLPEASQQELKVLYRGQGLSLERVILDLHSGRIFGPAGPLLADMVAVLFILLALTGIWMWFKTRRKIP